MISLMKQGTGVCLLSLLSYPASGKNNPIELMLPLSLGFLLLGKLINHKFYERFFLLNKWITTDKHMFSAIHKTGDIICHLEFVSGFL